LVLEKRAAHLSLQLSLAAFAELYSEGVVILCSEIWRNVGEMKLKILICVRKQYGIFKFFDNMRQ